MAPAPHHSHHGHGHSSHSHPHTHPHQPSKKDSSKNLEPEEILQAVVLADSFNERFRPLTLDKPRCLLPLANVPLIEYTLEFLAVAGVQEIFIICCAHADQIKEYIARSKWSRPNSSTPRVTALFADCYSAGDALRELDAKQLIKSDFILVSGDIVSNINLGRVLEEHRIRRNIDKSSIMTMVVKQASPNHRTRPKGEESLFVLDTKSNQCLHYDQIKLFPGKKKISLELESVLDGHAEIMVRNDLIDCQIDICSPEVPVLFTENFDFADIRTDFVKGILESDLLDRKIYCHVMTDQYAARVRSTQMYESITKDMMSRWSFPMVPDSNILEGDSYRYSRGNIYKEKNVILSRSAKLVQNVIVGSGTEIGENTIIKNSVIGRNCKIMNNVVLDGVFCWNDVTISDSCMISRSILADKVRIENNTIINRGCLLSFGTAVGPNICLPPFTKLTCRDPKSCSEMHSRYESDGFTSSNDEREDSSLDEETDEEEKEGLDKFEGAESVNGVVNTDGGCAVPYDRKLVGEKGIGYAWEEKAYAEDSEDDLMSEDSRNIKISSLAFEIQDLELGGPRYQVQSSGDDEESDTQTNSEMDGIEETEDELESHYIEIAATIDRAFIEGHAVETAALELNTLKMALNVSFNDLRNVVVPKLMDQMDVSKGKQGVETVLKRWGNLIKRLTPEPEDQTHCLAVVFEHVLEKESLVPIFVHMFYYLYDLDLVDEDIILDWYKTSTRPSAVHASELEMTLLKKLEAFIQWLQKDESSSEESDSGSDDSSSGDEESSGSGSESD